MAAKNIVGIRWIRRFVVLSLGLVTFAPTSAEAQCAWAVWQQLIGGLSPAFSYQAWRPMASYEEKGECDAMARKWNIAEREKGTNPVGAFYVCLPDTMDPRGPRGR